MAIALTDEEAGRQVLGIFVRYRVPAGGTLRRLRAAFDLGGEESVPPPADGPRLEGPLPPESEDSLSPEVDAALDELVNAF